MPITLPPFWCFFTLVAFSPPPLLTFGNGGSGFGSFGRMFIFSEMLTLNRGAEIFNICVSSREFKTISVGRREYVRRVVGVGLFADLTEVLIRTHYI